MAHYSAQGGGGAGSGDNDDDDDDNDDKDDDKGGEELDMGDGYRDLVAGTCEAVSAAWHDEGYTPTREALRGGAESRRRASRASVASVASVASASSAASGDSGLGMPEAWPARAQRQRPRRASVAGLKTARKSIFMDQDEEVVFAVSG